MAFSPARVRCAWSLACSLSSMDLFRSCAVHPATAIAAGAAFGIITLFVVRLAIRARRNKSMVGVDALIGLTAIAQQPLSPSGQVLVHGELWQAESPVPVEPGEKVQVRGVRNLTLLVERIPAAIPEPTNR